MYIFLISCAHCSIRVDDAAVGSGKTNFYVGLENSKPLLSYSPGF